MPQDHQTMLVLGVVQVEEVLTDIPVDLLVLDNPVQLVKDMKAEMEYMEVTTIMVEAEEELAKLAVMLKSVLPVADPVEMDNLLL